MISPSKVPKTLGIAGAAAILGLAPAMFAAAPAFAVAPGSASLTISPTTTGGGATASVTNSFATSSALPSGDVITITSKAISGTPETLPVPAPSGTLGVTGANYVVTYTPSGGTATPVAGTVSEAGNVATITTATPIPLNATVTVNITGATNPSTPSSVYFSDNDSTSASINTNLVSIANPAVSTPTVTSVNPTAFTNVGGQPFTVLGTNFSIAFNASGTPSPVVCFVQSGTTVPSPSTTSPATNPCPATTSPTAGITLAPVVPTTGAPGPGTQTSVTTGEIQGLSPLLSADKSYNVVVYNFNGGASTPTYTPASATSSQTLTGVRSNLDFVPESGIRVVDSRLGLALPRGSLPTGQAIGVPLTNFAQSPVVPTNVPAGTTAGTLGVSGLALNVTGVAPAGPGNIQMWTGTSCTTNGIKTATVNFQPPQDTNNSQILAVHANTDTQLCIQDNGASVNLVVDVTGYSIHYAAQQQRLIDTRPTSNVGNQLQGPLAGGTVYRINLGPATYGLQGQTVAFNVAAVAPSSVGNLRVFPEPATGAPTSASGVPLAAVVTYIPNTDSSAMLITTVPASGYLDMYSDSPGTVNVVLDELGVFPGSGGAASTNSLVTVSSPFRIFDSRPGGIQPGSSATVVGAPSGSGSNFVPAAAVGVVGNLADINPAGQGYLVAYPAGGTVPGTASIAHFPAQTRSTNSVTALNPTNGSFSIFDAGAASNATFDVSAYITDAAP